MKNNQEELKQVLKQLRLVVRESVYKRKVARAIVSQNSRFGRIIARVQFSALGRFVWRPRK